VCLIVLAAALPASAQLTIYYGVTADYQQTGASTLNPDPRVDGAYHFSFIFSFSSGSDNNTDPVPTIRVSDSGGTVFGSAQNAPFTGDTGPVIAALGGSKDGVRFTSLGALQTAYPNYAFRLNYTLSGSPEVADTALGTIPALPSSTPQFTLSGGTWNSGTYEIAANQALGIVTNAFTAYSPQNSFGGDLLSLSLYLDGNPNSPVLSINRLNYTGAGSPANFFNESVAANTLAAGVYTLQATFTDGMDNDSVFGNDGPFSAVTTFAQVQVTAVPEPSVYATLAGALALGLAAWRRRRGAK
jgi:MYXO-CTERM domain-containing protein